MKHSGRQSHSRSSYVPMVKKMALLMLTYLTACGGSSTASDPNAKLFGAWNLSTVNGQSLPVTITSGDIFGTNLYQWRYVSADVFLLGNNLGLWADSTLSTAVCIAGEPSGTYCNASGSAFTNWYVAGNTITVVGTGTSQLLITLVLQSDGTLLQTEGTLSKVYRKQ